MKKAAILVLVLLLGLTGCSTVTNVGKVNDLITEGDQAYENKDYEGAIKAYTAARIPRITIEVSPIWSWNSMIRRRRISSRRLR